MLPLLTLSLTATTTNLVAQVQRQPVATLTILNLRFVIWNQLLVLQYRKRKVPANDTVSFAAMTSYNAKLVGRYVGTPWAWPANLVFAAEHDLPPARYDLMAGKYLFYRQQNLGGLIKVGDGRADPALFAGDWSASLPCGAAACREVLGRARILAPLDVPEDLDLTVRAQGEGTLTLAVNGRTLAAFPLEPEIRGLRARAASASWRRELNDVSLTVSPGGRAFVERLQFDRAQGARPSGQVQ
jgi:hypothetical protein